MAFTQGFAPSAGESTYTLRNLNSGESVKIRILSDVVSGFSLWSENNGKPLAIRAKAKEDIDASKAAVNKLTGKPNTVKQCIAAVVYNYNSKSIETLETDKATIIRALWSLDQDEDFGDLKKYDIKIKKSGTGTDTKYEVNPLSKEPVSKEIQDVFKDSDIDLEALFESKPQVKDEVDADEILF